MLDIKLPDRSATQRQLIADSMPPKQVRLISETRQDQPAAIFGKQVSKSASVVVSYSSDREGRYQDAGTAQGGHLVENCVWLFGSGSLVNLD